MVNLVIGGLGMKSTEKLGIGSGQKLEMTSNPTVFIMPEHISLKCQIKQTLGNMFWQ